MNLSNAVARVKGFFVSEVKVHPVTQGFRDEIAGAIAKQKAADGAGVPAIWPEYHDEGLIDQDETFAEGDVVQSPAMVKLTTRLNDLANCTMSRTAEEAQRAFDGAVAVTPATIRAATHATDIALAEVGKTTLADHGEGITLYHGSTVLINPADIGHSEMYADLVKESGETDMRDSEVDSDSVDVELTDMVFWDHFLTRLAPKGCLVVTDEHHLISKKSELARGYGVVRLTLTGEAGIVHVTKNGLNALFPTADGQFRAVSNNNRFDGKTLVQVEQAKGFLNGRY